MTDATAIAPLLSICIPTFNRAAMLRTCLAELRPVVQALPFPVEIVISDNHSTGETEQVARDVSREDWIDAVVGEQGAGWANAPGMRFIRPARHLEPIEHYFKVMRHARGKYAHYLADDDALLPEGLIAAVAWMEASPDMVASFNPQIEVEQGGERVCGVANNPVTTPTVLAAGDYRSAAGLLTGRPFHPEVPLVRADAWRRHVVQPRKIFYGFWLLASLLKVGDVGIGTHAYYKHRLRPQTTGAGNQIQWEFAVDRMDQNRLGMELLFLRSLNGARAEVPTGLAGFFTARMAEYAAIAARVCIQAGEHQAAAELMVRCALWGGTEIESFDEATINSRVGAEIGRRLETSSDGLSVVATAEERSAAIRAGRCPTRIIAQDDVREALRVAR